MKKILGLVASQRKLANGEIIMKEVATAAGENCQLELIRLADLKLQLCRACYTCLIPGKKCPLDDGLYYLAEKIKEADGIIIAAPCYVLGPAAVTKLLGDRMIALAQYIEDFWQKPCVVIGTAGINGWEGYTVSGLNSLARLLGFDLKDSEMFMGPLPGDGILAEGAKARAKEMGQALFGEPRKEKNGECPSCWSEVWKFPDPATAVCPFCGQKATITSDENGTKWVYGDRSKMYDKEHMKDHFHNWLRVKVQEYFKRKDELAEVRAPYKEIGTWLKPE